jgi:hypothetical protein
MNGPGKGPRGLWILTLGPAIWSAHFLACYLTAAIWCAKAASPGLGPVRAAIGAYTLIALGALAVTSWWGWRRQRSALSRDDFLGFTTLLLCGLASVAVLYVALPAVFAGSCR